MKTIIVTILSLDLLISAAGCNKKSECEAVYDHVVSILPDDMKASMGDAGKERAMGKCEKATPEQRKCMLEAKTLADVGTCNAK